MYSPLLSPSQNLFSAAVGEAAMRTEIAGVIPDRVACAAVGCGPSLLGGSLLPNCAVCNGEGYVTTYMTSIFQARIFWLSQVSVYQATAAGLMTNEQADLAISFPLAQERDIRNFLVAGSTGPVFFIVDGKRVRPTTSQKDTIDGETSFVVYANLESRERD